ncbi:LysR family transcriptional regulator [Lysobacter silvisoli]|uniref:LysR family transcriptional regulator n=1 Tax=Lysobacter silvisoli TaxID=2293254 RepID=A0A371JXH6_9GAMM|nr:LysR family transcriptional regulator [Lysobacter silvisoli]RDZ26312.1 LysR family transcriptional regulator [Lysobacter silvisoli]
MIEPLTLDQLRVFVAVVDTGSFRAAAAQLRRVQSAVSHAIANLESQLGLALFDRSTRRPQLTDAGRALVADARAVLRRSDALRARAHGLHAGVELQLAVAVDALFPLPRWAQALSELRAAFTSLALRCWTAPLGAAVADLRERRCDAAITAFDTDDAGLSMHALAPLVQVAVVAASHPLAARCRGRALLDAVDLAEHLQLAVEDPTPLSAGRDYGVLSPDTWRVGDLQTKHALILAGAGWGSLPLWLVEADLAQGRLLRVPAAALGKRGESRARCWFAHRADSAPGAAARWLRDRLSADAG